MLNHAQRIFIMIEAILLAVNKLDFYAIYSPSINMEGSKQEMVWNYILCEQPELKCKISINGVMVGGKEV